MGVPHTKLCNWNYFMTWSAWTKGGVSSKTRNFSLADGSIFKVPYLRDYWELACKIWYAHSWVIVHWYAIENSIYDFTPLRSLFPGLLKYIYINFGPAIFKSYNCASSVGSNHACQIPTLWGQPSCCFCFWPKVSWSLASHEICKFSTICP